MTLILPLTNNFSKTEGYVFVHRRMQGSFNLRVTMRNIYCGKVVAFHGQGVT